MTGTQGCGVNAPIAAAVAAWTCGLLKDWHMPKGIMFFMGIQSATVATGKLTPLTRFSGVICKVEGATPILHCRTAPWVTKFFIIPPILVSVMR
jgi:hypothetical protein